MTASGRRICRALERRGWRLLRVRGSHHVYQAPDGGRSVVIPVHANRDLPPKTFHRIMKDAGLAETDL